MRQAILLLPVDDYDRRDDAEAVEGTAFPNFEKLEERFPKDFLVYPEISDFMDDCNNQEINLELYWMTYVKILS